MTQWMKLSELPEGFTGKCWICFLLGGYPFQADVFRDTDGRVYHNYSFHAMEEEYHQVIPIETPALPDDWKDLTYAMAF